MRQLNWRQVPLLWCAWLGAGLVVNSMAYAQEQEHPKLSDRKIAPLPAVIPSVPSTVVPSSPTPLTNTPTAIERPINTLEAIAMRQELEELIGRVENAINTAQAAQANQTSSLSSTVKESPAQAQAILAARQLLKDMPQMIQGGKHNEVRSMWQQVRQALWQDYPTNLLMALPEVRAMWLDRGSIVAAGSEAKLEKIFDRMAAVGVNTVFLETVNAGYTIYPSRVAPQQNPLIGGWDPLASAVKLAHARNMELHAWVWVFAVGNKRHNLLVQKPEDYIGPVLELHPDWANRRQDNAIFAPEGKVFLDPANPEVQNYLLSLYREIVTQYKVDGLQLDYIRYPRQDAGFDFGFGTAARQQFQALTGVDPINITMNDRSLWSMWTEFRTRQVNQFVARASKEMRQLRPNIILSAAVFPWKPLERINKIQQNWETWVLRGDIDLLVPMTYAQNTSKFLQQEVNPALAGVAQSPVLFLPGVLIRDLGDVELLDQLQAVRDLPSGGYSLFAAEHLRPSFASLLRQIKTDHEAQILPYRQPFAAALSRYQALRQEWQSLLQSDRLWIRGENLSNWQKQSELLEQALSQLNSQPTTSNFQIATSALKETIAKFRDWMRLESLERPYRVATWVNRLEAIDTILRYGERTVLGKQLPTTAIRTGNN